MSSLRNSGIGMLLSCCNTILNKDEDVPMKNPALSNPLTHLFRDRSPIIKPGSNIFGINKASQTWIPRTHFIRG